MWMAEMETERFSWRAYGETKEKAEHAILKLWNTKDCYQRDRTTLKWLKEEYGIHTEECIPKNSNFR